MRLVERFWATVTVVINWLTLSPVDTPDGRQYPITGKLDVIQHDYNAKIGASQELNPAVQFTIDPDGGGPVFKPPSGRPNELPGGDFVCQYPTMKDWVPCSTPNDRRCWLRNTKTGDQYNIFTDYETKKPRGIVRNYTIVLTSENINADGLDFPYGKVFKQTFPEKLDASFPGPWIQACWGDTLNITVINRLPDGPTTENGTAIHWHGLRQLNSMQHDGVPGITQCPIMPNDYFVYNFSVTQYGSTWYHSHYSMQYADGTQGPITLHGPSSSTYDEPKYPLIMTDWGHNSAFNAQSTRRLLNPSIVLNGRGNINRFSGRTLQPDPSMIPQIYTLQFEPGKRYLLRLINTAFQSPFQFTIDGHELTIVEADLVPVSPKTVQTVNIAIGQRYNVIVQALDKSKIGDGNFWIRTPTCRGGIAGGGPDYMKTGIIRYNAQSTSDPQSVPWPPDLSCIDEAAKGNVVPVLPWNVGPAANDIVGGENVAIGGPEFPRPYPLAFLKWDITESSSSSRHNFQIDYGDPIFLRLANPQPRASEVVLDRDFEDKWVYMVLICSGHPIHLHGHDFAIVDWSDRPFNPSSIRGSCPNNPDFMCKNPPRRDVIECPSGYAVIAFKTDNPGSWLMHCHIATHAGGGLALQILERQEDAAARWPPGSKSFKEASRVCKNWRQWASDVQLLQDDSGV